MFIERWKMERIVERSNKTTAKFSILCQLNSIVPLSFSLNWTLFQRQLNSHKICFRYSSAFLNWINKCIKLHYAFYYLCSAKTQFKLFGTIRKLLATYFYLMYIFIWLASNKYVEKRFRFRFGKDWFNCSFDEMFINLISESKGSELKNWFYSWSDFVLILEINTRDEAMHTMYSTLHTIAIIYMELFLFQKLLWYLFKIWLLKMERWLRDQSFSCNYVGDNNKNLTVPNNKRLTHKKTMNWIIIIIVRSH